MRYDNYPMPRLVSRRVIVILPLFERPARPMFINCHNHTMKGNCSASQRVLANSLRVVSTKRGNPPLEAEKVYSVSGKFIVF